MVQIVYVGPKLFTMPLLHLINRLDLSTDTQANRSIPASLSLAESSSEAPSHLTFASPCNAIYIHRKTPLSYQPNRNYTSFNTETLDSISHQTQSSPPIVPTSTMYADLAPINVRVLQISDHTNTTIPANLNTNFQLYTIPTPSASSLSPTVVKS